MSPSNEGLEQEPALPVEEGQEAPKPEKITFSAAQQEKVGELIRAAQSRAGREAKAELARLKSATPEASTDILVRLAQAEADVATLRSERQDSAVREALHEAVGSQFIDSSLAVRLLKDSVRVIDGQVVVIDADGSPRLNSALEPMTLKQAAQALADSKPFLAKGLVKGGIGSTVAERTPPSGPKLDTMFGPASTSEGVGRLHKLSRFDPPAYQRLRAAARAAGLVR